MLVFHWSWLTPTHYLFFIRHGLRPGYSCFSLAMVYTLAMLVFCWSQPTPRQCLFFIGHNLQPHIACFLLALAYTHAMLFLLVRLTPTQCLIFIGHGLHPGNASSPLVTCNACFLVIILLILSTTGYICQQYPPVDRRSKCCIITMISIIIQIPAVRTSFFLSTFSPWRLVERHTNYKNLCK